MRTQSHESFEGYERFIENYAKYTDIEMDQIIDKSTFETTVSTANGYSKQTTKTTTQTDEKRFINGIN